MFGAKTISIHCPCSGETEMAIAKLMRTARPRCRHCKKGVTIDRAWLLVEVARLQRMARED